MNDSYFIYRHASLISGLFVRELQRALLPLVFCFDRLVRIGVRNRVDDQLRELSRCGACVEEGVLQDPQILVAHLPSKAGLVHLRAPHAK